MGTKRRRQGRWEQHLVRLARAGLLAGLAGAAACTVFDGLSVPPPAGSSSASSSGAGGAGETGGAGGVATSGGGGGGTASAGGAGGAAGAGGAGGAPPIQSITLLAETDAARVCSRAFTCPLLATSIALSVGVPVSDTNYSQCMTWLSSPIPSRPGVDIAQKILTCVAAAASCAEAASCLPVQAIEPADPACGGGSKCIDNMTALDCTAHLIYHCLTPGFLPGSGCQGSGGVFACAKDNCNSPGTAICDNNTLATCTNAGIVYTPCEIGGLTCSGQPAACLGVGACGIPGASSCQGDTVEVCGEGQRSTFNCAKLGLICLSEVADMARCGAPAAACTPTSMGANQCSANKKAIDACVGGSIIKVTCPPGTSCQNAAGGKTAYCG